MPDSHEDQKKIGIVSSVQTPDTHSLPDGGQDVPDQAAQAGIQQVQAIAISWTKRDLIIAYVLIWTVYFVMLLQQGVTAALLPYVTSAFEDHSLTPTVGVLSSVIGGVCNLTVAKILDVFGRPQGYGISLFIATIGLVMMAATTSVEMFAAAQVFWTVGNNALLYSINIFVADTSALHNRGLMTALTSSPNIITTFLGGPIAQGFRNGPGWQWAFGAFAIMVPVLCSPLLLLLIRQYFRAKKQGILIVRSSKRTPSQSITHYVREFDAVGLLLLSAGLALFLLPFNLYTFQPQGWKSPLIICLLVFGVILMICFALWEKFFAPFKFIPYSLLLDRNLTGSCILGAVLFISYSCWNSFFSSFLQVVQNLSIADASYVIQGANLGSSFSSIAAGYFIRRTGRFKYITLFVAIPIYALFTGLLIHFRFPETGLGWLVISQIFIFAATGILVITPEVAALSAASHQHIAVTMAILSMFSSIGGAIGFTVAGAIWQNVFPNSLAKYLPAENLPDLLEIYGALEVQLSFEIGTPARIAIQHAYGDAQSMILIAGTAIWIVGFVSVTFWRNTDVRTIKQVKGTVI